MSLTNFKKFFILRVDLFILMGLIFFLLSLGRWQWQRAHEKQSILDAYALSQTSAEQEWNAHQKLPHPFQKIRVKGSLSNQVIYLDNQFRHHQLGYEVFVPIELESKTFLLVDIAWVPLGQDRNDLPLLHLRPAETWHGFVYYPSSSKVDLGHFLERHDDLHYVVERLDTQKISKLLRHPVLPWVMKTTLEKRELVSVTPQKHIGYAIQWWVMAFVAFIIFMWRLIKK
jgi:surfeit locus 1 family protein